MLKNFRARILIVDDEEANLIAVQRILEQEAYEVLTAKNGLAALALFRKTRADLVITDLRMPELGGLELLAALRKFEPDLPVLLLTAFGTVDDAVEAMKLGAVDFLAKPLRRPQLLRSVEDALSKRSRSMGKIGYEPEALLGQSPVINELRRTIHMIAPSEAAVLIRGESGTGKELVAKAIHAASGRKGKLVSINCGAIPEPLLESELFGYSKGAFTGAAGDKMGLFEEANEGTLFLDEIGDMPTGLQIKLLRALEDHKIRRVGSLQDRAINFRIVAATNADLAEKIKSGAFRYDLFYRLNVIHLQLPPLRERTGDIPYLANVFLVEAAERYGKVGLVFREDAESAIQKYGWPGNVRELRNVIERAVVLCQGQSLSGYDLQLPGLSALGSLAAAPRVMSFPVGTPLEEIEREVIRQTLSFYDGDKRRAAQALGVNLRTIYRKLDAGL